MKGRRWATLGLAALAVMTLAQGWLFLRYVTISPGRASPAASLVRVEGKESPGNLLYVVVVTRRANLIDWVRSWFDPLVEVRPAPGGVLGSGDWREYAEAMESLMERSRAVAATVALRGLAGERGEAYPGAGPGDWSAAIDFDEGGVLGDSAGLMMALELYFQLRSEGPGPDLLIAGTGTLEPDGTIRPVDGIAQKIHASRAAGAKVFLLPRANLADVDERATGMRLIPVDTFEQALAALQRLYAQE